MQNVKFAVEILLQKHMKMRLLFLNVRLVEELK
jgi:hypothetical protein